MSPRGRCRCGEILTFRLTSAGYKTTCPRCGAVVRLNPHLREKSRRATRPERPAAERGEETLVFSCPCGERIELVTGNLPPLVVCPACHRALSLPPEGAAAQAAPAKRPPARPRKKAAAKDPTQQTTMELSAKELAELARELSAPASAREAAAATAAASRAASASSPAGWEHGARACEACGQLLALGSTLCQHCGHRH